MGVSKLDQLRAMTVVVADTGDIDAIRRLKPVDCTTNPTLVLKAVALPAYEAVLADAIAWGRGRGGSREAVVAAIGDRLAVAVGAELARLVPGRVSTEVDADLSFDTAATVEKARAVIAAYEAHGIPRDKILVKIAGTWEGIQASRVLQAEGIDTNVTLIFDIAQAIACADAKSFLISPFVGRILDWYVKAEGRSFGPEEDPGVVSVRAIYRYYKAHGIGTVVMGASFRSPGEVEALAGCDRLTISPQILDQLAADEGTLTRVLSPDAIGEAPAAVAMDERAFRWAMNENPMATEKLAEGIRLFAKDLGALRKLVAARLDA
ncbi:transaldolase [Oharaeibacter diazotrophicus]|uniref:Transaldolase n=1 Tax=Oharaeibacter diazotrophicus TaxID=1920512 RepID=A0A4R6RBS2_9HYPH|nr:transaldolase [Oharaeibacter diazotrophicus]TDP83532.1 transaldolase [Oharaeibacter diazotrophicus]BBE72365.1 transaldolase [Pleomorphomonas sp. SM30]GLS79136.1 transaldolase [Oharaeibacter diazotrophicus]